MAAEPDSKHETVAHTGRSLGESDHLLDDVDARVSSWIRAQGSQAFRTGQIREWIFKNRAADWSEMTNLPAGLREAAAQELRLWSMTSIHHTSANDGTEKLLLGVEGGQVECVLLRDRVRRTICISSQVGCGMGCVFCASGLDGVERNLQTGEIVEQALRLDRLMSADERLSHVVVMGMGEPLANLPRLLPALEQIRRPDGLGIGARRMTISTVGLPAAIRQLARSKPHYRLAVSLHAPNDELRNEIVPVNKQIGLADILDASDEYFAAAGRQLTFEYVLLAEINNQPEHAAELAELLRGREALLNVIPYNPVAGLPYRTPSLNSQKRFRKILEGRGLNIRFRHRKGDKIDAACGQLRRRMTPTAENSVVPLAVEKP